MSTSTDLEWMHRCLELAQRARGYTSPNPMVGCVIVKDGEVLGEGWHPAAGQPHAEVFALRAVQANYPDNPDLTKGATLYVNLEPCNHHGRTPPCSEAIIQAGIGEVFVGMVDPDPRVSGGGCDRLRAAGIKVTVGIAEAECQALNEAFCHRVLHQVPFGILKYAMTLDGKIATTSGHSYWITGEPARRVVHRLRADCDAVITGGNTVRLDNPHLTTHGLSDRAPLRVVLSRSLDLPNVANLWQVDAVHQTLVVTLPNQNPQLQTSLRDRGVEVLEIPNLSVQLVMTELAQRGCNSVLWECGGVLAAQAIAAGAVQKIYAFIAPKLIGGENAPSPIADLGFDQMTQARSLHRTNMQQIGNDWLITGYLN
ncbi:bifunctional diaminohydroxyphosphoribosylaminopyrimidine deaminase/5-amino-6-(5-phosphoribosylamino)uracil reductase RibD [Tumidithrix helvetica PCC 7403]|uniref:bifunctional diaminohydroxyphosphoribosylaminopyrimidine deaminase/5-amino-6-(5-phosphoribosylamino)uracil reductase RibD n=1 Tax=Tumidithrix helvetica TaxID=3457545 RepID=UPI003C96A174